MSRYVTTYSTDGGYTVRIQIFDRITNIATPATATVLNPAVCRLVSHSRGLRELPVGILDNDRATFEFLWSELPAPLQNAINDNRSGTDRTRILVEIDRGTGYTVQHFGVIERILGQTYSRSNGRTTVEVETVDAMIDFMKSVKMSDLCTWLMNNMPSQQTFLTLNLWDLSTFGTAQNSEVVTAVDNNYVKNARLASWQELTGFVRTYLDGQWNLTVLPTGASVEFDSADVLDSYYGRGLRLFPRKNEWPPAPGAATRDDPLLVTHLYDEDNILVGGVIHTNDKYGLNRWPTLYDFFTDLSEGCFVKHVWNYTVTDGGGIYTVNVAHVLTTPLTSGSSVTYNADNAQDDITLDAGTVTVGSAEVRLQTEDNRDTTQHVSRIEGSRAERSFNLRQPPFHNMPVYKQDDRGVVRNGKKFRDWYTLGIFQTDTLWFRGVDNLKNANERAQIAHPQIYYSVAGATNFFKYESADFDAAPTWGESGSGWEQRAIAMARYELWLYNVQLNGCVPATLAMAYARLFASEQITTFELTFPITQGALPTRVGERHTITGDITTAVTTQWDTCMLVGIEYDFDSHTVTHSYVAIPTPTYD